MVTYAEDRDFGDENDFPELTREVHEAMSRMTVRDLAIDYHRHEADPERKKLIDNYIRTTSPEFRADFRTLLKILELDAIFSHR